MSYTIFPTLIRKDIVDELLPPGEYGNPAMYIQDALIDQSLIGRGVSFNQITIKGIEYYTAATDGNYYGEDFYATIGLCYEDEEVELFRLCTIFTGSRDINMVTVKRIRDDSEKRILRCS